MTLANVGAVGGTPVPAARKCFIMVMPGLLSLAACMWLAVTTSLALATSSRTLSLPSAAQARSAVRNTATSSLGVDGAAGATSVPCCFNGGVHCAEGTADGPPRPAAVLQPRLQSAARAAKRAPVKRPAPAAQGLIHVCRTSNMPPRMCNGPHATDGRHKVTATARMIPWCHSRSRLAHTVAEYKVKWLPCWTVAQHDRRRTAQQQVTSPLRCFVNSWRSAWLPPPSFGRRAGDTARPWPPPLVGICNQPARRLLHTTLPLEHGRQRRRRRS